MAQPKDGTPIEVGYSGGKDSDVILQLAKESGINFRAIYKNTTIDPPGTVKHVRDMGVEILNPKMTFAQIIQQTGLPSRRARICCRFLKEYKILDKSIIGVRREESIRRAKLYKEPTECRIFSDKQRAEQIYPILDWTLDDVVEFAQDRKLKFAPTYYDESGVFHPERRLGCLCCPLMSKKKRIKAFAEHPGMIRFYIRNIELFMKTHPNSKTAKVHQCNPYSAFARNVMIEKKNGNYYMNRNCFHSTQIGKDFWKNNST